MDLLYTGSDSTRFLHAESLLRGLDTDRECPSSKSQNRARPNSNFVPQASRPIMLHTDVVSDSLDRQHGTFLSDLVYTENATLDALLHRLSRIPSVATI